ncbi:hypothetical protein [Rhizobium sp. GCM10022189]|uniref:hypothetical protein n=1 Tax=Rhizobium sp. GCM10022189 TaxID=3252654 RepID=UPI0036099E5E
MARTGRNRQAISGSPLYRARPVAVKAAMRGVREHDMGPITRIRERHALKTDPAAVAPHRILLYAHRKVLGGRNQVETARFWVEVIAAAAIPIGIIAIIWNRTATKKSLSVRAIQFLCLTITIPLVLILSLEGILDGGAIGALLGALVGYLFSNIGKYDEKKFGSEAD